MPLARIFGIAHPARGAALQAEEFADRPEPPLAARRRGDQRRRVRRRLVRGAGDAGRLPQHRARLERPQPARALRPPLVWTRLRAHPRLDGLPRAANQLPPVPPWPLAMDAQRLHRQLQQGEARSHARSRSAALPRDRGHDRQRGVLPPRAHVRPRGRPAARSRARGRLHRSDRKAPRQRAPDPDDRRDNRRRERLGVQVLERRQVAFALLQHGCEDSARSTPGQSGAARGLR